MTALRPLAAPFQHLVDAHPTACFAASAFVVSMFALVAWITVIDRREDAP